MTKFLTYVHAKPDASSSADIFYVGKGSRARMKDLASNRNQHHKNIVKKYGATRISFGFIECSTEQNALDLERGLIKILRQSGVKIVNLTDGGDGVSGWKMPEHQKQKMKAALKGRTAPNKGLPSRLKGRTLSAEHKQKLSKAKRGVKSPRSGVTLSDEIKDKISKSQTGYRWLNNGVSETKCSLSIAHSLLNVGFKFGRLSINHTHNRKEC